MKIEELIRKYQISGLVSNTVMVVDDEIENVEVMSLFMGKYFKVLTANSGQEAYETLKSKDCDVVIVDQRMPGMTGVQLLDRINQLDRDITGIVVTAFTEYQAIMDAINQGNAFKFLIKPLDTPQLLAAVREAMERTMYARAIRQLVGKLDHKIDSLEQKNLELQQMQHRFIQAERFSTVGRMTSGIVHEMGNALSSLMFIGQELQRLDCTKDLHDIFELSIQGLESLHRTLQDIMALIRNNGVVGRLYKKETNVRALLQDAVKLARLNKEGRLRDIKLRTGADLPPVILDRQRVIQALVNIINNAIDATKPHDQILIEAAAKDGWLNITVKDNGIGMDEEVLQHVVEPLFSTKESSGLGMGMYMVDAVIKAHGGFLDIHSKKGEGTMVSVVLPYGTDL